MTNHKNFIAYSDMPKGSLLTGTGTRTVDRYFNFIERAISSFERTTSKNIIPAAEKKEKISLIKTADTLTDDFKELVYGEDTPFALVELKAAKADLFAGERIPTTISAYKLKEFNKSMTDMIEESKKLVTTPLPTTTEAKKDQPKVFSITGENLTL